MLASTCRKATSRFVLFTKYRSYTNAHTNVSVLSENPLVNLNDEFVKYARVKGEHVVPAVRWALDDFNTRINELETHINKNIEQGNPLTWEEVMDKREVAGTAIERVWGAVNHLKGVRDDSALRKAYDEVQGEVVSTFAAYGQSETLFKAYESIANQGGGAATLTNTQRRVIDQAIRDATHAGVALQGEAREKYKSINMELSNLTTQFSQNVVDSTNAFSLLITDSKQVEGVPANLRLSMATAALKKNSSVADDARVGDADKGPWLLTLDATVFGPFMQTGTCAETREVLYKAYQHRASEFDAAKTEGQNYDNAPIIKRILELRQEKAQMLGYDTYTDMSLAKKMAQNVTNVNDLLEPLFAASRPAAVKELAQLKEFAQQNGHNGDLQLWDVSYWAEKQKLALFGLTDEDLRPYFALPNVLDGMFDLANEIFSISISEAEMPEDVAWDKHVRLFEVKENREGSAKGTTIAKFFMDAFSRPGVKRGGAWMDTCVGKSKAQHHDVPVAFLVCNQTTPAQEGQPSLMTFREVETLFHEFGHSLQHMLTTVDCGDAAGINGIEWDAVELPSQMMENFCYEPSTIDTISAHHKTGKPLPDGMFNELCRARTYMAGTGMLRQLLFSAIDLQVHNHSDKTDPKNPFEQWQTLRKERDVVTPLPTDRFLCGFSHIFAGGYSSGYFSYKWAEVLSQDAYESFAEASTSEERIDIGARFRDTVLSLGGSVAPSEVFESFKGREPNTTALLKTYGLDEVASTA